MLKVGLCLSTSDVFELLLAKFFIHVPLPQLALKTLHITQGNSSASSQLVPYLKPDFCISFSQITSSQPTVLV